VTDTFWTFWTRLDIFVRVQRFRFYDTTFFKTCKQAETIYQASEFQKPETAKNGIFRLSFILALYLLCEMNGYGEFMVSLNRKVCFYLKDS